MGRLTLLWWIIAKPVTRSAIRTGRFWTASATYFRILYPALMSLLIWYMWTMAFMSCSRQTWCCNVTSTSFPPSTWWYVRQRLLTFQWCRPLISPTYIFDTPSTKGLWSLILLPPKRVFGFIFMGLFIFDVLVHLFFWSFSDFWVLSLLAVTLSVVCLMWAPTSIFGSLRDGVPWRLTRDSEWRSLFISS